MDGFASARRDCTAFGEEFELFLYQMKSTPSRFLQNFDFIVQSRRRILREHLGCFALSRLASEFFMKVAAGEILSALGFETVEE